MNKFNYQIRNNQRPHHIVMRTASGVNAFQEPKYKDYLISELKMCQEEKGLLIHAYILLDNQIHLIGFAKENYDLAKIIGNFRRKIGLQMLKIFKAEKGNEIYKRNLIEFEHRARTLRKTNVYQFWEVNKNPAELISKESIVKLIKGFHETPVIERLTDKPENYPYSSAKYFSNGQGSIKTDPLDYSILDQVPEE